MKGLGTLKKAMMFITRPGSILVRRFDLLQRSLSGDEQCKACGFQGLFLNGRVLWPELIEEWELTPEWVNWFDLREGHSCPKCGSSLRAGQLSEAIIEGISSITAVTGKSLRAVFNQKPVQALCIAEINSAGTLHQFLATCPNLRYSEYGSKMPGIPSEDLTKLSYDDESFDLVITSETLEHVPNIDMALREVHRILKPDGMHVFTVPIICDRHETRQTATIQEDRLIHLLPPSYHGGVNEGKSDFLVFYEFGSDFIERCEKPGFHVLAIRGPENPALVAFIARKTA